MTELELEDLGASLQNLEGISSGDEELAELGENPQSYKVPLTGQGTWSTAQSCGVSRM